VRLTDLATGKALANYQDPSTFRAYEQFAQVARQVQMEKYPELANQFRWGGYFSGGRGKYGAMDQMHFDLGGGRVGMGGGSWENGLTASQRSLFPGVESFGMGAATSKATQALDKLATSSVDTAKSLSGGLGKLGNSLSQFPSAPSLGGGGGGGLFGSLLGGLTGGLSSAFSGKKAFNWLSSNPGGYIGLYADGTENAPEGWAWVGERGPELRKLRAGDVIRSNPRSMEMVANQNGRAQSSPSPKFDIHIYGGSGDDHIRKLVEEGSRTALAEYQTSQVRGGFGSTQRQYSSFKG
jgi:hypothetical protein